MTLCLAACNRGSQTKDAVRQGIVDYLKARNFSMTTMDVAVSAVQFMGNNADATVTFTPKGSSPAQGMEMQYQLELQKEKWVVVGRKESGAAPHGGAAPGASSGMPAERNQGGGAPPAAAPSMENPHGGAQMPAPEALPPAGKKK